MRARERRKTRRAAEQAAFETVYWLGGPDLAIDWIDMGIETKQLEKVRTDPLVRDAYGHDVAPEWGYRLKRRYRCYRCPRCEGCGTDPEQPRQYEIIEPPDPCGFCGGYGTLEPKHYRMAAMLEARAWGDEIEAESAA